MARKAGVLLQRQWRERLERFRGSTWTVAEFCRREKVSVASFYQWRKKLAGSGHNGRRRRTTAGKTSPKTGGSPRATKAGSARTTKVAKTTRALNTTKATKPTFLPVQIAGTGDGPVAAAKGMEITGAARVEVAFPNGAMLRLFADDPALIKLAIEAVAHSRTVGGEA